MSGRLDVDEGIGDPQERVPTVPVTGHPAGPTIAAASAVGGSGPGCAERLSCARSDRLTPSSGVHPAETSVKSLLSFVVALATSASCADIIEVNGILGSVDPGARTISLTRKTAKGNRVDELDVALSAGRLTTAQAGAPVRVSYETTLDVVTRLTPEMQGQTLDMHTIQVVEPEGMPHLVSFRPDMLNLVLPRLRHLTPAAARELATHPDLVTQVQVSVGVNKGGVCVFEKQTHTLTTAISLPAITEITFPVAEQLARAPGDLHLDGLRSLTADVARALAAHGGEKNKLSLNGLETLDIETARSLVGHQGPLLLDKLSVISDALAEILASRGGSVSLQGVTTMSDKARTLLDGKASFAASNTDTQAVVTP